MTWFVIYDEIDGRLVSQCTVVGDDLPKKYIVMELPGKPARGEMWDSTSRAFVPRPEKVLIDQLAVIKRDLSSIVGKLTPQEETTLDAAIVSALGDKRYISEGEAERRELSAV